ncbi:MAG: NAD(P)-binding domain-containing protein [Myxococcales bacterium]|nr:NAD(P)-binding domain-containing protein [Myxococcales bacterium]
MKIAIIGAGKVGTTLGERLQAAGHAVTYGVRDPASPAAQALRAAGAGAASVADAVAASDGAILATPWGAAQAALAAAGDFAGKLLIDATNPIGPGLTLTHGHTDSGAEQVQRWAPTAKVVKAFNSTGRENMAQPDLAGGRAVMVLCGDDPAAVAQARGLAEAVGFEAVSLGALADARLLEPLALVWIKLAFTTPLGRDFAFGLLRRV